LGFNFRMVAWSREAPSEIFGGKGEKAAGCKENGWEDGVQEVQSKIDKMQKKT